MIHLDFSTWGETKHYNAMRKFYASMLGKEGISTRWEAISISPFYKNGDFDCYSTSDLYFDLSNAAVGPQSLVQLQGNNNRVFLHGDLKIISYLSAGVGATNLNVANYLASGPLTGFTNWLFMNRIITAGALSQTSINAYEPYSAANGTGKNEYQFNDVLFSVLRQTVSGGGAGPFFGTYRMEYLFNGLIINY